MQDSEATRCVRTRGGYADLDNDNDNDNDNDDGAKGIFYGLV